MSTVLVLSGYARSQALLVSELRSGGPTPDPGSAPGSDPGPDPAVDPAVGYWEQVRQLAPADRFPNVHAVLEAESLEEAARSAAPQPPGELDDEVRFGFDRILDGIDVLIRARTDD
jgi:hypothetical protein